MPVKILLADKSITIQKVVEMLFSGKEYEVVCVSDGESALSESARVHPDVVLADVDLPRVDGYNFSARLKQMPPFAQTPVILMLSRDDVLNEAKARQVGIIDTIAKPFESQELIGKVKKALTAAQPRIAEPAPAVAATRPAQPPPPKQAVPSDIFDIIQEAPTRAEIKRAPSAPRATDEEAVFEVEPVVEMEERLPREAEKALPLGEKAVKEMREGLGLAEGPTEAPPEIASFESFDAGAGVAREYVPPPPARKPELARPPVKPPAASEEMVRSLAEEAVARIAKEYFRNMPQPASPRVSEETVRRGIEEAVAKIARDIARDVIEKVAWEVIPDLAEMLIKAEIERLKGKA